MSRKVKIDAMEVLIDIENGLSHLDLMNKYALSPKGLRSLLIKLRNVLANFPKSNSKVDLYFRLVLNSTDKLIGNVGTSGLFKNNDAFAQNEILNDLLAGMNSEELMEKHGLSKMQLSIVLEELASEGDLHRNNGHYTIPNWQPTQENFIWAKPVEDDCIQRHYLITAAAIYAVCDPDIKGELLEVAGERILIKGISSVVDQISTLVMQSDNFLSGKPLVFDARCDWIRPGALSGLPIAEFTIINMAECVQEEFLEFLSLLSLTMHPIAEPRRSVSGRM